MQNDKSSMYVARSDDFGQTWRAVLVEPLQRGTDKDILAARDGARLPRLPHTAEDLRLRLARRRPDLVDRTTSSARRTRARRLPAERWRDRLEGQRLLRLERRQQPRPGEGHEEPLRHALDRRRRDVDDFPRRRLRSRPFRCGCTGWDYWGPQMALGVDAEGSDLRPLGRRALELRSRSACTSPARPTAPRPGARAQTSRSLRPDRTISSRRSSQAATATSASPGWTTGTASTRVATIRVRAGTSTTARRRMPARVVGARRQLSQYRPRLHVQVRNPEDGFAEPYGDYFELDIDGAGQTHAIWGEGRQLRRPRQRLVRARLGQLSPK